MNEALRIAVVGAGGIGSTFAFQLARVGGHAVTVVARPGSTRLAQLQRDGAIVMAKGERAAVRVADALDAEPDYDLVLVTVLAHQVDAVLPALVASRARCIQFMFNTFDPERLRDAVGAERCAFGMPFVQATVDAEGKLHATIGAAGQKCLISAPRSVSIFVAAGLPAVVEPNMTLWLRCHVPLCVAFESASVAAVRRSGGASWAEAMVVARGAREGFTLVERLGYALYPSGKVFLHRSPAWVLASLLWLVTRNRAFRELLGGAAGECRALVDVMLAAAARATPPIALARLQAVRPAESGGVTRPSGG